MSDSSSEHDMDGVNMSGANETPQPASQVAQPPALHSSDAKGSPPPDEMISPAAARPSQASKDIVLQRLSRDGSWDTFGAAPTDRPFTQDGPAPRRALSIAAMIAMAAAIGAIGGGLTSLGAAYFWAGDRTKVAIVEQGRSIESAIAKINADLAALKSSSGAQSAKIVDRMDRVEKAQVEPAAKLAKLSDAVEKLRPETTGSIAAPVNAAQPLPTAQPGRLPIVQGWTLRDVSDGGATVEGRQGLYEVFAGDPLPGLGRVDAIRRQDGRWVVVTSKGLIVAR